MASRLRSFLVLGHKRAGADEALLEAQVAMGIVDIEPAAEHRDSVPRSFERRPVGGSVDAHGQARNHHDAGGAEVCGQLLRHPQTDAGRPPGAYHRDHQGVVYRKGAPLDEQATGGRIGAKLTEPAGPLRLSGRDDAAHAAAPSVAALR